MPRTLKIKSKRTPSKKPVTKSKPASRVVKKSPQSPKATAISVPVLDTDGKPTGKVILPPELFAAKVNKTLLAQAVRVYLANQRAGSAATKTRGEVEGSTRKIYRQKGTGRARHGAIRAPIFVGGGIVFGPTPHSYRMDFPKNMKRAALASALTSAFQEGKMIVGDGLGDVVKTKIMAKTLRSIGARGSTLLVVGADAQGTSRAARNIADVDILPAQNLYAYTVLMHQKLVFMKEAIEVLKKTFV